MNRRIIDLLPVTIQSDDLKNFFSSTIDHLFQNGKSDHLAGYIGRRPEVYDTEKEFYINGRTLEREFHQLEPTMVSVNTNNEITHALFYDDLVSSLRSSGSIVNDENRLFEGNYYSWAPPIDIDKINNFTQYYWYPEGDVPVLELRSPFNEFEGDGSTTYFAIPEVIDELESDVDVLVNGVSVTFSFNQDLEVILDSPPANGAEIKVYRYSNLRNLIEGQNSFDPRPFIEEQYQSLLTDITSGTRVALYDAVSDGSDTYYLEDKAKGYRFVQYESDVVLDPIHVVIERGSLNENPWSKNNRWVHRACIEWSGNLDPDKQAKRPIIEFDRRLEIYLYGDIRLADVDAVITGTATIRRGWDRFRWDTNQWDIDEIGAPIDIEGQPVGSVTVDNDYVLQSGDRLLIAQTVGAAYSQRIVTLRTVFDESGLPVFAFDIGPPIEEGSMVNVIGVGEFVFKNNEWVRAQEFVARVPPLFALYDTDGISLTDKNVYVNTEFSGNRIFGYGVGTGSPDQYLNHPLMRNSKGEIVFENDLHTKVINYDGGKVVDGYRFYRLREDDGTLIWRSDWHVSTDPSLQTKDSDYNAYTIPTNLQANPDNDEVEYISRSEWFDHFASIIDSQDDISGVPYSGNNYRDTLKDISLGKKILQHRSPLLRTMLVNSDENFDLLRAIRFIESEYLRFRGKFNQKLTDLYLDGSLMNMTPEEMTKKVLDSLRGSRTTDFAFAYSEVGGGQYFIPQTPSSIGVARPTRPEIIFDESFGTPIRMVLGHDGSRTIAFGEVIKKTHDGTLPRFVLKNDPYGTVKITINNVETTSFFQTGKLIVINGALSVGDNIVIEVNDIRDSCNLALETLIYDNIDSTFKAEIVRPFRLDNYIAGRFYEKQEARANYSVQEFNQVLYPFFLSWAQSNQVDYRTNDGFDVSDPFTWNYRGVKDYQGQTIPVGNWRGLYHYFYGTHRPHQAPWEMLGFFNRPSWWLSQYGNGPYASTETAMWEDIRDGYIANGPRQGTDARYARPDLLNILPVDSDGNLRDPMDIGLVLQAPDGTTIGQQWEFGDMGPTEHLWRISHSYPFAIAASAYLLKPSRFIEANWDTYNNQLVYGVEWINRRTKDRPVNAELYVHGETIDGSIKHLAGVQQWISELMISRGQSPSILGRAARGLNVRLGHRLGGFASPESLRVSAENFGIIPEEDARLYLYNSPSQREEYYSGVIVEWSGNGWRVIGYDASYAAFKIIPGDPYGPKETIRLDDDTPVLVDWKPKVYYKLGILAMYQNSTYECIRAHTSSGKFEQDYWEARPDISTTGPLSVQKTISGQDFVSEVPYGTVFKTRQEVADFIFAYERYLLSRGWVFYGVDEDSSPLDWTRMVKEFLDWTQVDWEEGNFIALSPGAERVDFFADNGTIRNIESNSHGIYGVVDREGMPIPREDVIITRLDGEVTIRTKNKNLAGLRVSVSDVEHALIISNETIFGDVVYKPILDIRQQRLRLVAQLASDWRGRLNAPGYLVTDGRLVANFDKAAEDIRYAFDIEDVDNIVLRDHARHVIGYENRDYLNEILLSDTQQFEFHQGMIQQKGAPDVFNKLLRSDLIGENRVLKFLEEWAIKAGTYGSTENTLRFSFILDQAKYKKNPQSITIRGLGNAVSSSDSIVITSTDFIETVGTDNKVFPERASHLSQSGDYLDAGFVRIDEVLTTAFRTSDLQNVYDNFDLEHGSKVWVYENENFEWDVLRAFNISNTGAANKIARIVASSESEIETFNARVYFENAISLSNATIGSYIAINGETRSEQELSGIQKIVGVGVNWIDIDNDCETGYVWLSDDPEELDVAEDPENAPTALLFRSMVFANSTEVASATSSWLSSPIAGDLIFYKSSGRWVSEKWSGSAWQIHREQPYKIDNRKIFNCLVYDTGSEIVDQNLYSEPLVTDHILVYDPLVGSISGEAERELTYKLEYDPAKYQFGNPDDENWGAPQLGHLWWDLSTVRFLNPMTDVLTDTPSVRNSAEIEYRQKTWGNLAPGSRIDVYEWTRSLVAPSILTDKSHLYKDGENWVEALELEPRLQKTVTVYYFWSKKGAEGRLPGRKLSLERVTRLIENPAAAGVPWIAAISRETALVHSIENYLKGAESVLQIEVLDSDSKGVVHNQWKLLRPNDERSIPDQYIWNRMVDSLVGWDQYFLSVPQTSLHPESRQGIAVRPRQSLFSNQNVPNRTTALAARESLVGIINRILARKRYDEGLTPMSFEDVWGSEYTVGEFTTTYLHWSYESSTEIVLPPFDEYNYRVSSIRERDELLLRPSVRTASSLVRILVNGLQTNEPHWAVWAFDPNDPAFVGMTDEELQVAIHDPSGPPVFRLVTTHEYEVLEDEEFFDIIPDIGERVLYHAPDGYWRVLRYNPDHPRSATSGLTQGYYTSRSQSYKTSDFVERVDWYAEGYTASRPPIISYETETAMRNAEENPINTFVKVLKGSHSEAVDRWVWFVYENGEWTEVAREKGTFAILPSAYDETRTAYRSLILDYSDRDAGNEIRRILEAVYTDRDLFTELELNEIFFNMVNFAHAHCDQVNWAFKTSFLHVSGYNEALSQSPTAVLDRTQPLLNYLDEVKPYRVKTREFSRSVSPPLENLTVLASDFDKPVYRDPDTNAFRPLSILNANDLNVVISQRPWSEWFQEREGRVRKLNTWITFDRIDGAMVPNAVSGGVDTLGSTILSRNDHQWANTILGSAQRIDNDYTPTSGMAEKSIRDLMNMNFKGDSIIEGETITNGATHRFNYDGRGNHLVSINPDVNGIPGYSIVDPYHESDRPEELIVAGHHDCIYFKVKSNGIPGAPRQIVRTFQRKNLNIVAGNFVVSMHEVAQSNSAVAVFCDGLRLPPSSYQIDHFKREIYVPTQIGGEDVRRVSFHLFGFGSTSKIIEQRFFSYIAGAPNTFSVSNNGIAEIVVNGVFVIEKVVSNNSVQITEVTLNDGDQIIIAIREPSNDEPAASIRVFTEEFSFTGSRLFSLSNPTGSVGFSGDVTDETIVEVNGLRLVPNDDYQAFANGTFLLANTVSVSSVSTIVATTFKNHLPMDIETHVFEGVSNGEYTFDTPEKTPYLWVTVNGRRLIQGADFRVLDGSIKFSPGHSPTDTIVVTTFLATPAVVANQFLFGSIVPGKDIMHPIRVGDYDTSGWDETPWDDGEGFLTQTVSAPSYYAGQSRRLHHMDGGWEYVRVLESHTSTLATDLTKTANSIIINKKNQSEDVFNIDLFGIPQPDAAGVIWINGERIEYGSVIENNDTIVLSGLERGTKGTRIGDEQRAIVNFEGDGSTTQFFFANATSAPITAAKVSISNAVETYTPIYEGVNYTVDVSNSGATITTLVAPQINEYVVFIQTRTEFTHLANTVVYGAAVRFDPRNEVL